MLLESCYVGGKQLLSNASRVPGAQAADCLSKNGASRLLITAVLIVLFLLFFRYYAKSPPVISVMQVRASAFHPDMLMEKQPILIEDRVCDVAQLMRTTLKYYYTYARVRRDVELHHTHTKKNNTSSSFIRTYAAATFVSPQKKKRKAAGSKKVLLRSSSLRRPDLPAVDFLVRPGQVLVLPPHWKVTAPISEEDEEERRRRSVHVCVAEAYDLLHIFMLPLACSGALVRSSNGGGR